MPDDNSQSVGVYFNERDTRDVLEPFDETFENRSARIKEAMQLYVAVADAIEGTEFEEYLDDDRALRHWVRQAIFDQQVFEADVEERAAAVGRSSNDV